MKKIMLLLLTTVSLFYITNNTTLHVNATSISAFSTIEYLGNGYYYETLIIDEESSIVASSKAATQYITKTKTTLMKDNAGEVLWSVSIKATFSYDGTTSKCINCTPSAISYASAWTIKNVTSSKSGNSATATAIVTYHLASGTTQPFTKSVTIQCSPTGLVK